MSDAIAKSLTDRGLKLFEESEFVWSNRLNLSPNLSGAVAHRDFVIRVKVPYAARQMSMKTIYTFVEDRILREETENREYVQEKLWQYFKREFCITERGDEHPNIQKCLGFVIGFRESRLPSLVFNDVAVGDLGSFVFRDERATTTVRVQLMRDVAKGLAFLHDREIVHRDVQSSTILVDIQDGNLVALLSDFGAVKDFGGLIRLPLMTGEPLPPYQWAAPEYRQYTDPTQTFETSTGDMWAFGCTMVEVLACTVDLWPKYYRGGGSLVQQALGRGERPQRPATFPPWDEAWNFIHDRCWNFDPAKRITAREAVVELEELLKTVPPSV